MEKKKKSERVELKERERKKIIKILKYKTIVTV